MFTQDTSTHGNFERLTHLPFAPPINMKALSNVRQRTANSPKDELYRLIIISVSTATSASLFCAVRNVLRDNRVELGLRPFAR